MLDVMSGGRIICGFVRGIGPEYHNFTMNPATSLERFREAHDLILDSWTRPGPFRWEGKHYRFEYVNPWPRPPPAAAPARLDPVAGQRRDDRLGRRAPLHVHRYVHARSGTFARFMAQYRDAARGFGYDARAGADGVGAAGVRRRDRTSRRSTRRAPTRSTSSTSSCGVRCPSSFRRAT